jgi:hypothetical protein
VFRAPAADSERSGGDPAGIVAASPVAEAEQALKLA